MENKLKIEKELFAPLNAEEKKINAIVRPSIGYWKDAWRRLKKDKMALVSLIVIIVIVAAAILVPMLSKYDYASNDLTHTYLKPS